jgi:hypothetical protein
VAGIFIWRKGSTLSKEAVDIAFKNLGYKNGKYLMAEEFQLIVFQKSLYETKNWFCRDDYFVCGIGTFGYKGKFYDQSLPVIFEDINSGNVKLTDLWGSFIIVSYINGRFLLIRDGARLTRLYIDKREGVISSSFAAIIDSQNKKFNLDRLSVIELLTTGVITGENTIIDEIKCVSNLLPFNDITIEYSTSKSYPPPVDRDDALKQQIQISTNYIRKITIEWLKYFPDGQFDLGMTGGMDSRLLAILTLRNTSRVLTHTHWRKDQFTNADFKHAHIFAEKANLVINTREVTPPLDMTESQLENNFENSYCLSDGVIRPGVYWDEEYSTEKYRKYLCNAPYLRILGFGGEQYRNVERLPQNSNRNLKSWIKWEMMYQFTGRYFLSEYEANIVENRMESNLIKQFGKSDLFLNLYNFKRYIQLVQSPSYRSMQATIENRIGFCLNPFLDTHLSVPSLLAIPFLGKSLNFQLDMMKIMSPTLTEIPNSYGFDFTKGEPNIHRIGAVIWQKMPPQIKYPAYARYKNYNYTDYILRLETRYAFIRELISIIEKLDLPINLAKHKMVRSRSRLILNLAYFLLRSNRKIYY